MKLEEKGRRNTLMGIKYAIYPAKYIHCNIIIGTNIDSICKSYVILSIRYIPRNSIGFINRIPRYIRDRLLYT